MKIPAIAMFVLAACGGSGGGGIAFEQVDEEYANAFCAKLYSCCTSAEAMQFGQILGFTDEATCRTSFATALEMDLVEDEPRIQSGELTYDGEAASECVSQISEIACPLLLSGTGLSACERILKGKAANGQPCMDDETCSSAYCDIDETEMGLCTAVPGNGQTCTDRCDEGLGCVNGTCKQQLPNGQACEFSSECQSGICDVTCMAETVCDGDASN